MAKETNKVDIQLYDLAVTPDPNDYFGRVRSKGTIDNEAIASRIKKEGSEYQAETIIELLNRADRIKSEGLAQGYNVNTGFVNARLSVSGVFYEEVFDPKKHQLNASINLTSNTRELIDETKVTVLGQAQTGPVLLKVVDSFTGEINAQITPSNAITIYGDRIKIDGSEEFKDEVGLFFINLDDQSRTKVTQLINNENKAVIFMVPALAKGNYELELVTQLNRNALLKAPRSEKLEAVLIVN
ncbi:DNA-binding domain-containing protein [Flammeovirga sp. OC4]|uniref:DNA-binding domain-containing protein n=1 Tax=Flammeovirga sp. OC4 TaxID=1382345 RepID=UPI0005C46110|nr:DNA-binding domain-containing protein [Flammeovirga sp. OC4]